MTMYARLSSLAESTYAAALVFRSAAAADPQGVSIAIRPNIRRFYAPHLECEVIGEPWKMQNCAPKAVDLSL